METELSYMKAKLKVVKTKLELASNLIFNLANEEDAAMRAGLLQSAESWIAD